MMSKWLEAFRIGREIALETVSALGKRRRDWNRLVREQSMGFAYEKATEVGFNIYYKPLKHCISASKYSLKYKKIL